MDNRVWLLQKQYEEVNANFRTSWDIYIKFYTVFLTFNVGAMAVLFGGKPLDGKVRWPVIFAFMLQDVLCAATSALMARFSWDSGRRLREAIDALLDARAGEPAEKDLPDSSLPVELGRWAGWANCWAMIAMTILWACLALWAS
jgi:hypothetical protein